MSRKFLAFLLNELTTLRLRCKKCRSQATVEVPIDRFNRLDRTHEEGRCQLCGEPFFQNEPDRANYLKMLADALDGMKRVKELVEVEFVVPVDDEPAQKKTP